MTPGDLAFVFLRLGAVLITCFLVTDIPWALEFASSWLDGKVDFLSPSIVQLMILFGLATALWFGAGWISRKIAAPLGDPTTTPATQLNLDGLLAVAIVVAGLLILAVALPRFVLEVFELLTRGLTSNRLDFLWVTSWPLIYKLIPVSIGLVCVLSPNLIIKLTKLLRI